MFCSFHAGVTRGASRNGRRTGLVAQEMVLSGSELNSILSIIWVSLGAQLVKNLPAMRETWVRSLSREDPLEEEMAIHSIVLAWKISWSVEPGGPQSLVLQRVGHN